MKYLWDTPIYFVDASIDLWNTSNYFATLRTSQKHALTYGVQNQRLERSIFVNGYHPKIIKEEK